MHIQEHGLLTAEFPAVKCKDFKVEWFDSSLRTEAEIAALAYFTQPKSQGGLAPGAADSPAILFADRYGGPGTGFHGGSARCGTIGGVQIKGIGTTPLLTDRSDIEFDRWHFNGMLDIFEAIREAIWSKICQSVLPYGAVSALGVISSAEIVKSSDAAQVGAEKYHSRALLVREAAWRPAHFLRNIHYFSGDKFTSWEQDRARTVHAIQLLPRLFEAQLGVGGGSEVSVLNAGFLELSKRFASQVAAAFARRIFHGALSPSNIALDGRFLDFGTMSCVPGFRRRTGAPAPTGPDFWAQKDSLALTLRVLLRHTRKYQNNIEGSTLISEEELLDSFFEFYASRCSVELVKLLGVGEEFILAQPKPLISKLTAFLTSIISDGAHRPYAWLGDDDPASKKLSPLFETGRYDLSKLLSISIRNDANGIFEIELPTGVKDVSFSTGFNRVVGDFLNSGLDWDKKLGRTPNSVDSIRRINSSVSFLTRESLDSSVRRLSTDGESYGSFIDRTVSAALHILKY